MPDVLIINVNIDPATTEGCEGIRDRLLELRPRLAVTIVHWLTPELRALANDAQGIILGPNENPFPSYPDAFQALLAWVKDQRGPLLGICGGHQVLALAYGASVAPVHPVAPATESYAGMPKVEGLTQARRQADDPLCADLPLTLSVSSSHVDEVKELPREFQLSLEGRRSRIQMIKHERHLVWGVQFHPEHERSGYAGARLLEAWLDHL